LHDCLRIVLVEIKLGLSVLFGVLNQSRDWLGISSPKWRFNVVS